MFTDPTLLLIVITSSLLMFVPKLGLLSKALFWKLFLAFIINTALLAMVVFLVPGGKEGGIIAVGLFALSKALFYRLKAAAGIANGILIGALTYFLVYDVNLWSVGLSSGYVYLNYRAFKGYRLVDKETATSKLHQMDKENIWFCVSRNAKSIEKHKLKLAVLTEIMDKDTSGLSFQVSVDGVRILVRSFIEVEKIRQVMERVLDHNKKLNDNYEIVVNLVDIAPTKLFMASTPTVVDSFSLIHQCLMVTNWDIDVHLSAMSGGTFLPSNLAKAYIRTPEVKLFSN